VSLGTVLGTSFGTVVMAYLLATGAEPIGLLFFTIFSPAIIFVRHLDNIGRLLAGRERVLKSKADNPAPGGPA
jgi:glycerol-3-phosphate acyltransferase PlsY